MSKLLIKDIATGTKKLSRLINKYERDEITTDKFRALVYGISKLLEAYYKFQIEFELEELRAEVLEIKGTN